MIFPQRHAWPLTLADQAGVWCAECLDYIEAHPVRKADAVQLHHPLRQSFLDGAFGKDLSRGWTVPVHQKCHQMLIDRVSGATHDFLDRLRCRSIGEQDLVTSRLHLLSLYSLALPAKLRLIEELNTLGEVDIVLKTLRHLITTAAGTSWGGSLLKKCLKDHLRGTDIEIDMNLACYASSCGAMDEATKFLDCAGTAIMKQLPRIPRLEIVFSRRNAQRVSGLKRAGSHTVEEGFADAQIAYEEAESAYSRKTALTIEMSLWYQTGNLRRTWDTADELVLDVGEIPWLYKAEAMLFKALCELERQGDPKTIYRHLIRAQYIYCMLGLQGHAPIETHRLFPGAESCTMPGQVLMRAPCLAIGNPLSASDLKMIRLDAIGHRKRAGGHSLWHAIRDDLTFQRTK